MTAPDLITVFNTCGLSGKETAAVYIRRLFSLLEQNGSVNQRVVWSSCCNQRSERDEVRAFFGDQISYYETDEVLTVNQTFNHACMVAAQCWRMPGGFVYVDWGVEFGDDHGGMGRLWKAHRTGRNMMTAALANSDTGFDLWYDNQSEDRIFSGRDGFVVEVGRGVNLHCQIFDRELMEGFGRILPDIFASFCTESTFTFLCAAKRGVLQMRRDVRVLHEIVEDSGSAGFAGARGWDHLLPCAPRPMAEIIADPEAWASGLGYEECRGILMHDRQLYDNWGSVRNPDRLARFIKANLFLPDSHFDYAKIKHTFTP